MKGYISSTSLFFNEIHPSVQLYFVSIKKSIPLGTPWIPTFTTYLSILGNSFPHFLQYYVSSRSLHLDSLSKWIRPFFVRIFWNYLNLPSGVHLSPCISLSSIVFFPNTTGYSLIQFHLIAHKACNPDWSISTDIWPLSMRSESIASARDKLWLTELFSCALHARTRNRMKMFVSGFIL